MGRKDYYFMYYFEDGTKIKVSNFINVDKEVLLIELSLSAIRRIFFHPAKFDNFKDEKISDYKTVSVAQSKNLVD